MSEVNDTRYGGFHLCQRCGAHIANGMVCVCAPRTAEEVRERIASEAVAPSTSKDKSMIWDDCAECAHKHLTASFSALTSGVDLGYATAQEIYAARALIAVRESQAGYRGNLDLAVGCLAMAELTGGFDGGRWRTARQLLATGKIDEFEDHLIPTPSPTAWAAAHLVEACRELPAVADRICLSRWLHADGFSNLGDGTDGEDRVDILETLKKAIHWVVSCYELRGGK